jgi:Protein of unknown function (DUF3618)
MVETTAQIETHIETTREHLGANLDALEEKLKSATDWRAYFQSSPGTLLGAAFAGGVALAMVAGTRRDHRAPRRATLVAGPKPSPRVRGPHTQEVAAMLDNIKGALIGVAAARMKDLVAEVVPGFQEEFDRRKGAAPMGPASPQTQPL